MRNHVSTTFEVGTIRLIPDDRLFSLTIILAQCVPFTDSLDRVVGHCFGHGERSDWLGIPWLATVHLVGDGLTEGLESHVETTVGELCVWLIDRHVR